MAFLLNSQCFVSWAAPDPCPTSEMRENLGKDLQDVCWDLMLYSGGPSVPQDGQIVRGVDRRS